MCEASLNPGPCRAQGSNPPTGTRALTSGRMSPTTGTIPDIAVRSQPSELGLTFSCLSHPAVCWFRSCSALPLLASESYKEVLLLPLSPPAPHRVPQGGASGSARLRQLHHRQRPAQHGGRLHRRKARGSALPVQAATLCSAAAGAPCGREALLPPQVPEELVGFGAWGRRCLEGVGACGVSVPGGVGAC